MDRYISTNLGLLVLRLGLGINVLMHGIFKIYNGIDGVKKILTNASIAEFVSYGVYIGEVVAPVLIIMGIFSRVGAFLLLCTCCVILYTAFSTDLLALNSKTGGFSAELVYLYISGAICILFCGSGKYAIIKD